MKKATYATTNKRDAVKTAQAVLQLKECLGYNFSIDIIDGETSEVLFTFNHGNIEYIEGNFARLLIK